MVAAVRPEGIVPNQNALFPTRNPISPIKIPNFNAIGTVLVLKPSSLGDIVHTLPAVRRLKLTFPHLRIDWLANPEWAPVLRGNPDLTEVVEFPRREFRGVAGFLRFRKWLRDFKWRPPADVALDFQGLFRSAYLGRKSGARCVVGLSDSREGARFLHHVRVQVGSAMHSVDRYLALAAACGAAEGPVQFPLPDGTCPECLRRLPMPRDFVILHPFSRGENKSMTAAQVRCLCALLGPTSIFLVGHGQASDSLLPLPPNATDLLNQTSLPELAWLMRRARFTVSVDSGPMHMAAAMGPNLLGIHTWSDPRTVGPYPADAWVWKGGHFWRRREVDQHVASLTKSFEDADVPPLADFIWERLGE